MKLRKDKIADIQVGFIAINKAGEFGGCSIHKGFQFALHDNDGARLLDGKFLN